MTYTNTEWRAIDAGRSCIVAQAARLMLEHATACARDEADADDDAGMGWREHCELIDAYTGGLAWWENHDGGHALHQAWIDYLTALRDSEYTGGSISEAISETLGD